MNFKNKFNAAKLYSRKKFARYAVSDESIEKKPKSHSRFNRWSLFQTTTNCLRFLGYQLLFTFTSLPATVYDY